jgi:hypothetical protein
MERRSKYNATPTEVDGIRFASQAEARRYGELKLLERAGVIRDLVVHPAYDLVVGGMSVGAYVGDFAYREARPFSGLVVEDVKGVRTPVYRLKRKLMLAVHGIDVREVRA